LNHSASPFMCQVFSRYGLTNYLPRLSLKGNPPDLCLLSSEGYRPEPPVPDWEWHFITFAIVCSLEASHCIQPTLSWGDYTRHKGMTTRSAGIKDPLVLQTDTWERKSWQGNFFWSKGCKHVFTPQNGQ
jgi:hypothetical protein